jgi:peptidoglycan/xylan/chitin deacetylase (PgdA/CDA1 family)
MMKLSLPVLFGFIFCAMLAAGAFKQEATTNQTIRREVAATFDDLPASHGGLAQMRSITTRLLSIIKSNRVPAVGFVNEEKLQVSGEVEARTALLQMWLDAGFELGNHTFSHINIDRVPLAAYEADVIRGEQVTRKLMTKRGMKLRYFRHPMLRTGPTVEYKTALDAFLAKCGYTIAPVTLDNKRFRVCSGLR